MKGTLSFVAVSGQEDSKPFWPRNNAPTQQAVQAQRPSLGTERRLQPGSMGSFPKPSCQTLGKPMQTRSRVKEKLQKKPVWYAGESPGVQAGGCSCPRKGPSPREFADPSRLCLSCLVRWFWNHT